MKISRKTEYFSRLSCCKTDYSWIRPFLECKPFMSKMAYIRKMALMQTLPLHSYADSLIWLGNFTTVDFSWQQFFPHFENFVNTHFLKINTKTNNWKNLPGSGCWFSPWKLLCPLEAFCWCMPLHECNFPPDVLTCPKMITPICLGSLNCLKIRVYGGSYNNVNSVYIVVEIVYIWLDNWRSDIGKNFLNPDWYPYQILSRKLF